MKNTAMFQAIDTPLCEIAKKNPKSLAVVQGNE